MPENRYFEALRLIAQENGGALLSSEWLGSKAKYRFAFSDGRTFEMSATNLHTRGWPKDPQKYFRKNADSGFIHLDELRASAQLNGCVLLSQEWLGARKMHRFAFADGREFQTTPVSLKHGWPKDPDRYFRQSSNNTDREQVQLDDLRSIAEANGGRLISKNWSGVHSNHQFAFFDGREFRMTPANLRKQGWPKDPDRYFRQSKNHFKREILCLDEMRQIAEANDGRLITEQWAGNRAKYMFAFADGRQFVKTPSSLRLRGWPKDADAYFRRYDYRRGHTHLEELRRIALSNGGRLVSEKWLGSEMPYVFEFGDGRKFCMVPSVLKNGSGWPKDPDRYLRSSGNPQRGDIHLEDLRSIARLRGGRLLANEWSGCDQPLLLEDQAGMQFMLSADSLRRGRWSPYVGRIAENVCRQAMDYIFGVQFHSTWRVVKRKHARPLELDGYSMVELYHGNVAVAFEYQGHEGHRINPVVMRRDQVKREYCLANNIVLIEIEPLRQKNSYDSKYVLEHVLEAVRIAFQKANIEMPGCTEGFNVDLSTIHEAVVRLEELRELAENNRGRLLSTEWRGSRMPHRFAFSDGREFEMAPNNLKTKGWPKNPNRYLKRVETLRAKRIGSNTSGRA